MSVDCWRRWARFPGLQGPTLEEWAKTHRIVVRVPVPRQKWPEPLVG